MLTSSDDEDVDKCRDNRTDYNQGAHNTSNNAADRGRGGVDRTLNNIMCEDHFNF
jgi:hypothetical protein